jgi:hypothetical protein
MEARFKNFMWLFTSWHAARADRRESSPASTLPATIEISARAFPETEMGKIKTMLLTKIWRLLTIPTSHAFVNGESIFIRYCEKMHVQ